MSDATTSARLLAHALSQPGAWVDHPWEGHTVAKVGPKIFAFVDEDGIGVKCGRGRADADEWLDRFPGDATAMSYVGRYGWNTLRVDGAIPFDDLLDAIDGSYEAVVSRLPRSQQPPAG